MLKRFFLLFIINIFIMIACNVGLLFANAQGQDQLPFLPQDLQNSTIDSIFTPNETEIQPTSKYIPEENTINKIEQNKINSNIHQNKNSLQTPNVSLPIVEIPVETQLVEKPFFDKALKNGIKIRKNQKFKVINTTALSDTLKKGSTISFVSTMAETTRYVTIPQNTTFKGIVVDSHTPNLTGNGGLLVIKVNKIYYNGRWYTINAKVTLANDKRIFLNNIKGKRMFWKNLLSVNSFGKKTYDKMWAKTKKYFKPSIEIIITPITFATGVIVFGANIITSPFLTIFSKGGKLYIPQNSKFEIKLLEEAIFY